MLSLSLLFNLSLILYIYYFHNTQEVIPYSKEQKNLVVKYLKKVCTMVPV